MRIAIAFGEMEVLGLLIVAIFVADARHEGDDMILLVSATKLHQFRKVPPPEQACEIVEFEAKPFNFLIIDDQARALKEGMKVIGNFSLTWIMDRGFPQGCFSFHDTYR